MELEEMQQAWERLSEKVEKQDILTNQLLERTTRQGYHTTLNRIGYPEFIGTLICYAGAGYVSVHLTKIEGLYMQVLAGLAIGLLLLLPILSLASVRALKKVNVSTATYLETIHTFARQKIRFQRLQKMNVVFSMALMLVSLPVLAAVQGKDLGQIPYFWSAIFPVFVVVFLAFAYWVLKSYNKTLENMENLLTDINK
jgi:hypothetical protein